VLSKRVERIAQILSSILPLVCKDSAEKTARAVGDLNGLMDTSFLGLDALGLRVPKLGQKPRYTLILERPYSSAHEAALMEGRILLDMLWRALDHPSGSKHKREWKKYLNTPLVYPREPENGFRSENDLFPRTVRTYMHCCGLNPQMVIEKSRHAADLIQSHLCREWQRDFGPVSARIAAERADADLFNHKEQIPSVAAAPAPSFVSATLAGQFGPLSASDGLASNEPSEPDGPCHPYTWRHNEIGSSDRKSIVHLVIRGALHAHPGSNAGAICGVGNGLCSDGGRPSRVG
jgi:hypothetical protein